MIAFVFVSHWFKSISLFFLANHCNEKPWLSFGSKATLKPDTLISKDNVGENGEWQIARPKGTVVSIFGMQKQGVLCVAQN